MRKSVSLSTTIFTILQEILYRHSSNVVAFLCFYILVNNSIFWSVGFVALVRYMSVYARNFSGTPLS